jgi:hypothetical protein
MGDSMLNPWLKARNTNSLSVRCEDTRNNRGDAK